MQIQSVNNYSRTNRQTNFKAAYPVVYWVKKSGTSEIVKKPSPTITKDLTSELQGKLVRYLNRTFSKSDPQKVNLMARAFRFLSSEDNDYRSYPIVRSFYNETAGSQRNGLKPIAYLLTGNDVDIFDNNFGKPIGRYMASSPKIDGKRSSAELDIAKKNYHRGGLNYVESRALEFQKGGECAELHVEFEPICKKNGEAKDYILTNMKIRPKSKRNINPFEEEIKQ